MQHDPQGSDKLHVKDSTEKFSTFQRSAFSIILYKAPAKLQKHLQSKRCDFQQPQEEIYTNLIFTQYFGTEEYLQNLVI